MDDYKAWLGKKVTVHIDRPLGSAHPDYPKSIYPINYGFIPQTVSPVDNEEIDVYILGPSTPLEKFNGIVIGVVVRTDEEMKLIVTDGHRYTALQIENAIYFQEQYYEHTVIVK